MATRLRVKKKNKKRDAVRANQEKVLPKPHKIDVERSRLHKKRRAFLWGN